MYFIKTQLQIAGVSCLLYEILLPGKIIALFIHFNDKKITNI